MAAFVAAQADLPAIKKTRTVTVRTKAGGTYNFAYAPLDDVIETLRPVYAKHKLAVTQLLDGSSLETYIVHESGEYFGSAFDIHGYLYTTEIKTINGQPTEVLIPIPPQELGSVITYIKRYAQGAISNLALDTDDDGNQASGNEATFVPKTTPPKETTKGKPATRPPKNDVEEEQKAETKPEVPEAKPVTKPPVEDVIVADETNWDDDFVTDSWDGIYETQLREALEAKKTVPEMMKFVQDLMKDIQEKYDAGTKAKWRESHNSIVMEVAKAKAN